MGRVLMWLFGVPVAVAALFAVLGEQSSDRPAHNAVTISSEGNYQ
jgi:hypothetical protein